MDFLFLALGTLNKIDLSTAKSEDIVFLWGNVSFKYSITS